MLDRLKKSLQIGSISAILVSTTILNSSAAPASDPTQVLGLNLNWQCGLSPMMKSTINPNRNGDDRILYCDSPSARAAKTISTQDPAAVKQLIQQGIQLLQAAQTVATQDPAAVDRLIQQGLQLLQTSQLTTTDDLAVKQSVQPGLQLLQTAPN